jgi:hypothetical protein
MFPSLLKALLMLNCTCWISAEELFLSISSNCRTNFDDDDDDDDDDNDDDDEDVRVAPIWLKM